MTGAALALAVAASTATINVPPAAWLHQTFGERGVAALERDGLVVLDGERKAERVEAVDWKAWRQMQEDAAPALALCDALDRFLSGKPVGPADAWARLARAPRASPVSGELALTAQTLAGVSRELSILGFDAQSPKAALAADPPLSDAKWGKRFLEPYDFEGRGDLVPMAEPFFERLLAGPQPDLEATAHLLVHAHRRSKADVARLIAADAKSGTLSAELKAELVAYLEDERRLARVESLSTALERLAKKGRLPEDERDLRAVGAGLTAQPQALAKLKEGLARDNPQGPVKLTSAGLHLLAPVRLAQYETGDAAEVTGAYWVDGLTENGSIDVVETTFVASEDGLTLKRSRSVKRRNGGPYAFAMQVPLQDGRPVTARVSLSADGANPVSESLPVPVARDFDNAAARIAEADAARQECRLSEAGFASLAESLAAPAKEKPQYDELLKEARQGEKERPELAKRKKDLEALAGEAGGDSTAAQCRFDDAAAQTALRLLRELPAGCDVAAPRLLRERAVAQRRRADQATFFQLADRGRSALSACRFDDAAVKTADGLAILDADPAVRCAAAAARAGLVETELLEASSGDLWRARLSTEIAQAREQPAPEARLQRSAAAAALAATRRDASCFGGELSQANRISQQAQSDYQGPDPAAALKRLGPDGHAKLVEAEIAKERERVTGEDARGEAPR